MSRQAAMTIEQLADYVRRPASKLLDLARAGELPGEMVGQQWRFHREHIHRWLASAAMDLHSLEHVEGNGTGVGCVESSDIEDYVSFMAPWNLELKQLSRGRFHSKVQYTRLPGMLVYEANWRRSARTHGEAPEGLVMIGTSLAWQRSRNFWCGRAVNPRRFACAGPKTEFGHISPDDSHHTVMLVERKLLAAAVGEEAVEAICRRKHLEFTEPAGERLSAAMTRIVRLAKLYPELLNDARVVARAQSALLEPLVGCRLDAKAEEVRESTSLRDTSVHQALDALEQSALPLTALELAAAVGVSQRTLEHGFRELLGVTPGVYLRRYRMNGAHRRLAHADPASTTVTEIALEWGFSHPGRFSADYRELFGELPSRTLNQPPKTTPCRPPLCVYDTVR